MATTRERRRSDGSTAWQVLWRADGRQTSATFDDAETARRYAAILSAAGQQAADAWLARPPERTGVPTLDEWAGRYVEQLTGVTSGTRAEYRRLYARTWSPLIGARRLDELDRPDVAGAVNRLAERLAHHSLANAHGLLSAMLAAAVEAGHAPANPCRRLRLPRAGEHERRDMECLSHQEMADLLDVLPQRWRPLVLTLVGTGLRWGEATALRVGDVDVEAATVQVVRARKRVPGGWEIGPPKTRRSRRTVTLPGEVLAALTPLLADRKRGDLLFTAPGGGPVHGGNFRARVWSPAVERAGLSRRPRVHDLRHTHASWLVAAGVPLPVIQRRLGHESITTTIDVYGHLLPDLQRQAAQAAQLALRPPPALT